VTVIVESALLRSVLGPGPAVQELRGPGDPATLIGQEPEVVADAIEVRRRQFAAGRACARAAVRTLGRDLGELLPGPDRAPQWPEDLIGSITHCEGFAGAAVASAVRWRALGIDAEPAEPLPPEAVDIVFTRTERTALKDVPSNETHPWDRILYSAKESLFKTWSPLRQTWLGFEDAEVSLAADGTFNVRLLLADTGSFPRAASGRWAVRDGFLATGLALPPCGLAAPRPSGTASSAP
jgi:4'-phosphopantetheinyl transferase EntD